MLEDALRAAFAARVEQAERARPGQPSADLAAVVVRRARRIRRRRTAATSVAAVVALVTTLGGAIALRDWHLPESQRHANLADPLTSGPAPARTASRVEAALPERSAALKADSTTSPSAPFAGDGPSLDVRVGSELWTTTGRRLRLPGVDDLRWVYRVRAGWVYGGAQQVRLLRPDGESVPLAEVDGGAALSAAPSTVRERWSGDRAAQAPAGLPGWVLSPDGTRLAFVAGRQVTVGTVTARGLAGRQATPVAADAVPLLFFGDSVVLTTDGADRYDIWHPDRAYLPNWRNDITHIYGAYGTMLLGLARTAAGPGRDCLVLIAQTSGGLRPGPVRGCGLGLVAGERSGLASPDGRWLAVWDADDVRLVDVAAAMAGATRISTCPVSAAAVLTWESAGSLVVVDGGRAIRCAVTGAVQPFPAPDGMPEDWRFVPSLLDT